MNRQPHGKHKSIGERDSRRRFLVLLGAAGMLGACRNADEVTGERAAESAADLAVSSDAGLGVPLELAWKRARERQRPLLVVLGSPQQRIFPTTHERAFGSLIEHGTDEHVAVLHAYELAFALGADVERVFGVACSTDAMLAVVEDASDGPHVHTAQPSLPAMPHPNPAPNDVAFDLAVWGPEFVSAERAQHAALVGSIRDLQSTDALASELAPHSTDSTKRAERLATLACEVRERWTNTPPVGARWGRDNGCGGDIEGGYSSMDCGMGYVPEPSRRFLIYYENE